MFTQFTSNNRRLLKQLWAPRVYGEAGWVLSGQIAAAIGGIVGVPLLAHFLRPEEYGQLALGGTLAALIQQMALGPLGAAGQRFYAASVESNALADYLRATLRVVMTSVIFVALIGALVIAVLANTRWHSIVMLAVWSLIFALLSGVSSVCDGIQGAARQRAIVAWHQGLGVWLRFGLAVLLVRSFSSASAAMLGFASAMGLTLVSQAAFLRGAIVSSPAYRPDLDRALQCEMRRKMWVYARPFSTWGLFTWGQIASDRWALESFRSMRVVGIYQALYQLGYYPISMASAFLNQLVQPILFARAGGGTDAKRVQNAHSLIHKLLLGVSILTGLGFVIAAFACRPLFRLLLPPAYASAAPMLPFLVLSAGIFECGQIISLKHMLLPNPSRLIAPKIATALLGAGLNFAGAYMFGLPGVVIASLAFSTAYCGWVLATAPRPDAAVLRGASPAPAPAMNL